MARAFLAVVAVSTLLLTTPARGQEAAVEEGIDPTRLDVERLPPEAIEVTRDLYSHGFFIEGWIGGRGFIGGVGRLSSPGVFASAGFGLEIFRFLWVRVSAEASFHATDAPPPPSPTAFELLNVIAEVRLQFDLGARVALWAGGEGGISVTTGDVLPVYGIDNAESIGPTYGGSVGFDWHMLNRHYSMGIVGGARLYPNLNGFDGEIAIGIHSAAYLRYVF